MDLYNNAEFFTLEQMEQEKKQIKKKATGIGVALLAVFGVMFFWSVPLAIAAAIMGIPMPQLNDLLTEPFVTMFLQAILMFFMVFLPFFVLSLCQRINLAEDISFGAPKMNLVGPFVLLSVGCSTIFSMITNMLLAPLQNLGIEIPSVDFEYPTGIYGVLISFLALAVIPAFVEEFAIRGVVLKMLRPYGDWFAIICSALVFGLMHASIFQIPYAFMFGVVLALAVIKTESIWTSILLHFINNAISITLSYAGMYLSETSMTVVSAVFSFITINLLGLGILLLIRADRKVLRLASPTTVSSGSKKVEYFIFSPLIIVCFVVAFFFGFVLR